MDKCGICNAEAEETHHIKEQQDADENKMIGSIHKNTLSNLVPLCKDCHKKQTFGDLNIKGYKQTTEGKELVYNYVNKKKNAKKIYRRRSKINSRL